MDSNTLAAAAMPPPPGPSRLQRLWRRVDRIFVLTVLLPTTFAAVYFGLVASDVFISETRFVVRSPQRTSATALGAILQGTGFTRAQDDTYAVRDFALSRDALRELDQKLQLRAAFSSPAVDVLNRFPGLGWDDSAEAFYLHYLKHLQVDYDPVSSIMVLTARAYSAETARDMNAQLLEMSERLLNGMNERSRRDLIDVAEREVKVAEESSRQAAQALSQFRAKGKVFDPALQSTAQLQTVASLQGELLSTQAQLTQLRQLAPNNPQVGVLEQRIAALNKSMAAEAAKITGADGSLSAATPTFDKLMLEKMFAEKQLAAALESLDAARAEARRKHLYLERLVQPNLPDTAIEPRRARSVLTVFMLGLIAWGVLSLVVSTVREHVD